MVEQRELFLSTTSNTARMWCDTGNVISSKNNYQYWMWSNIVMSEWLARARNACADADSWNKNLISRALSTKLYRRPINLLYSVNFIKPLVLQIHMQRRFGRILSSWAPSNQVEFTFYKTYIRNLKMPENRILGSASGEGFFSFVAKEIKIRR